MPDRPTQVPGDPSPRVIRRRLEAYLACPWLTPAERQVALDWQATHPEVAGSEAPGVTPEALLARAEVVLRLHAETRTLVGVMPVGMTRFRDAAAALARDACDLYGVDSGIP